MRLRPGAEALSPARRAEAPGRGREAPAAHGRDGDAVEALQGHRARQRARLRQEERAFKSTHIYLICPIYLMYLM